MKKRLNSYLYTYGKFGKRIRETVDTSNPNLYSKGRYATKITAEDLTEDYVKIFSRSLWYMHGYLKTSGIVDMDYSYVKGNHLFKDDYIYISYTSMIDRNPTTQWDRFANYDICISGNSIVDIVLAAEKYSNFDTKNIREKIEEKRIWLMNNEPDFYKQFIGEDKDIFTLWFEHGYVSEKLIK